MARLEIDLVPADAHRCENCTLGVATRLSSAEFLSYHLHRRPAWLDLVLEVWDRRRIVGCMPVSQSESEGQLRLTSHIGTVYAGLRVSPQVDGLLENAYAAIVTASWQEWDIASMEVRLPPELAVPEAARHLWSLWTLGFEVEVAYLGRALVFPDDVRLNRNRQRSIQNARQQLVSIRQAPLLSTDAYDLLEHSRLQRFGVSPLHSLADLTAIVEACPDLVECFELLHDDHVCAGAVLFHESEFTVLQYLFGSPCAMSAGRQDLLVLQVMDAVAQRNRILLFGTSTEPEAGHKRLNYGLDRYKRSWGARPYTAVRMTRQLSEQ